jgi:hypothetical protein
MYIENTSFYVYYIVNGKLIKIKENLKEFEAINLANRLEAYYTC